MAWLLFGCGAGPAFSTDFFAAAAGGSDANNCLASQTACKTLTHALALAGAAASPPHTVHAAAGVYDDVVNGEVFPLAPADGVGLVADAGVAVTTISQVNNSTATILYNRNMTMASSVILDGFSLVNANGGAGADAVSIAPQAAGAVLSPVIRNNALTAAGQAGIRVNGPFPTAQVAPRISGNAFRGGQFGVKAEGSGQFSAVIDGNTFTAPSKDAVHLFPAGAGDVFSPTITNNTIAQTGENGVLVSGNGGGAAVASPVISNNTVSGSAGMGIAVYGGGGGLVSAAVISGNTVRDSGGPLVFSWGGGGINVWMGSDSSSADINGNLVTGCTGYPIAVGDSAIGGVSPTVRNNTVSASIGNYGLYFYVNAESSLAVTSNTSSGNAGSGLFGYAANTTSPVLSRNTVTGNGSHGIYLYGSNTSSPTITSNSIIGNGGSGLRFLGAFATASAPVIKNNWFSGDGSPEVHIIAVGGENSPVFSSNTILSQGTTVGMIVSGDSKIDMGGGALGSVGRNTIRGAGGAFDLDASGDANALKASSNWWTDKPPTRLNTGVGGVDVSTSNTPILSFTVDPDSGPVGGGTPFSIAAADATVAFVDNVGSTSTRISVLVGGAPATAVRVNAAGTLITAVTPAGTAGNAAVFVRNPAGQNGTGTSSRGFTFVAAPSAAPAGLAGAALGVSSIAWSWTALSGATSYYFYPSTGGPPSVTSSTLVAQIGLSSNTSYGARVSAWNAGGEGPQSALASVYTLAGPNSLEAGGGAAATYNPPSGLVTVDIPAGAFPSAVSVTVRTPSSIPPSASGSLTGTGVAIEILLDSALQPAVPVPITVTFRDADVAGMDRAALVLARYDEGSGRWVPLDSTVDAAANTVTAKTRHFSIFQIMASVPARDLTSVRVIPNPFRPNSGHVAMGFFNLPPLAVVRIYTYAGAQVRLLTANAAGLAVWDGTNQAGAKVVSGVYHALVQAGGQSRTLTVAIER